MKFEAESESVHDEKRDTPDSLMLPVSTLTLKIVCQSLPAWNLVLPL